jgi:rod shape-determining protein MreD
MTFFAFLLIGYLSLALQATWVHYLGIAGIAPDLPLVATVLIALLRGAGAGTAGGFLIGLGQDLTNPAFLGLNALVSCLLGYAVGSLRERFDAGTAPTAAAVLFAATLAHDLLYLTIQTRLVLSEILVGLATRSVPTALYTAAVGACVFLLLASLSGRRGHRLGRSRLAGR